MDRNRQNGTATASSIHHHCELTQQSELAAGGIKASLSCGMVEGGLAPMVLINGRYYVPAGYHHCWPGRAGD